MMRVDRGKLNPPLQNDLDFSNKDRAEPRKAPHLRCLSPMLHKSLDLSDNFREMV